MEAMAYQQHNPLPTSPPPPRRGGMWQGSLSKSAAHEYVPSLWITNMLLCIYTATASTIQIAWADRGPDGASVNYTAFDPLFIRDAAGAPRE